MGIYFYDSEIGSEWEEVKSPALSPQRTRGQGRGSLATADLNDALFQHIHRNIDFFFRDNQRRVTHFRFRVLCEI